MSLAGCKSFNFHSGNIIKFCKRERSFWSPHTNSNVKKAAAKYYPHHLLVSWQQHASLLVYIYIYTHQLTEKPTHTVTNFIYRNQK